MKRALFLLLAITALLGGCQAPAENRTAAEAAASSAHIDAEEKQAAWDTYYDRLCEKSLLEHAMDAVTIVYGTVSDIKPSYQYKWQIGGDVSGTVAFTPAVIDVDTYYAFSDRYVHPGRKHTWLQAERRTTVKVFRNLRSSWKQETKSSPLSAKPPGCKMRAPFSPSPAAKSRSIPICCRLFMKWKKKAGSSFPLINLKTSSSTFWICTATTKNRPPPTGSGQPLIHFLPGLPVFFPTGGNFRSVS